MATSDLAYYSGSTIDQVIFSTVWETSVTNSDGTYTLTYGDTGVGQYARPLGIYSYDGGTTYNDFWPRPGSGVVNEVEDFLASTVIVSPRVASDGELSFRVQVIDTVGGGSTIPLIIKIALLANDSPVAMDQSPTHSSENKLAYVTVADNVSTRYRQILSANAVNSDDDPSGQPLMTTPHGAGVVPNLNIWFFDGTYNVTYENFWDVRYITEDFPHALSGMAMDATNLYIAYEHFAFPSGQTLYRTYNDS